MKASRALPLAHVLCGSVAAMALLLPALTFAQSPQATASQAASTADVAEIQRLIKAGQHAQALKLIDESLARSPKDPQMRFRRGVALSMLDRKAEALTVFQKLVEDHPDMPAPYNNMAVIYGAQGDYEKARGALERAIRTNPAYATAYQNLGDVYAQLASQAYSKALQLDKNDSSLAPKLSLLRELTTGNTATSGATVLATAKPVPAQPAATTTKPASSEPSTAAAKPPVDDKKRATARAEDDIEDAIKAWAAAWSRRDVNGYVNAYTNDFAGQAGSHKNWVQERKDRIATKKSIKVAVSELKVTVNGDRATARFRQSYQSDALSSNGRKTLELVRSGGKWLIRQESVGG